MTDRLLDRLLGTAAMDAVFGERGRLQAMLDFEAALARAEAAAGVIPPSAAPAIAAVCSVERFDLEALAAGAVKAGNLAIPMVRELTRLVAAEDAEAARWVHWGATSQDAIDTGLVLQLRMGLDLVRGDLDRLGHGLAALADRHRATPMVGRTWLQHALPVTLGLKAAGWLDGVTRHRRRLVELRPRLTVLQFGGAAGTLASLGARGLDVAAALAADLELGLPELPWHGQRDRVAEAGAFLGLVTGSLGKIARDVSLMMQTDVGETFEPAGEGRGGSSTMPHKRNPVSCAVILSAAARAPGLVATLMGALVQEHERGLGGWHAEWLALPELARLTAGALAQSADMIAGLEVDAPRMAANLEVTQGLVLAEAVSMALGQALGKQAAHELVERACRRAVAERRHLRAVLGEDPGVSGHLAPADLDRLLDPANYVGEADRFIERALAAHATT
jgi:3-carboxy-cis,cis-muconate cycloisomerase